MVYRLYRCNQSDISVLNYLFFKKSDLKAKSANFRPVDKLNSSVVFENISVSELYNGIPPWVAQEIVDTAYVSEDIIPDLAAIGYEKLWPAYYDSLIGKNPEYSRPVLMINSAVDGNTPLSLALGAAKYLHGPCQYFCDHSMGGSRSCFSITGERQAHSRGGKDRSENHDGLHR